LPQKISGHARVLGGEPFPVRPSLDDLSNTSRMYVLVTQFAHARMYDPAATTAATSRSARDDGRDRSRPFQLQLSPYKPAVHLGGFIGDRLGCSGLSVSGVCGQEPGRSGSNGLFQPAQSAAATRCRSAVVAAIVRTILYWSHGRLLVK